MKMLQGLPVILTEPLQHQQEASLLAKIKLVVVSHSLARPISLLAIFLFPRDELGFETEAFC